MVVAVSLIDQDWTQTVPPSSSIHTPGATPSLAARPGWWFTRSLDLVRRLQGDAAVTVGTAGWPK